MNKNVPACVLAETMDEELTAKVGAKHAKVPGRQASLHGSAPGSVVLGGRRVRVQRPRARIVHREEIALETYAAGAAGYLGA